MRILKKHRETGAFFADGERRSPQNKQKQAKQTKQADTDSVYDSDTEYDSDTVCECVNEKGAHTSHTRKSGKIIEKKRKNRPHPLDKRLKIC